MPEQEMMLCEMLLNIQVLPCYVSITVTSEHCQADGITVSHNYRTHYCHCKLLKRKNQWNLCRNIGSMLDYVTKKRQKFF